MAKCSVFFKAGDDLDFPQALRARREEDQDAKVLDAVRTAIQQVESAVDLQAVDDVKKTRGPGIDSAFVLANTGSEWSSKETPSSSSAVGRLAISITTSHSHSGGVLVCAPLS